MAGAVRNGLLSACPTVSCHWWRLFETFVTAPVQLRFPLSFRRDLELNVSMGTHGMLGKMTVVVLAKSEKKRGAGIQDRGQRATPASRPESR